MFGIIDASHYESVVNNREKYSDFLFVYTQIRKAIHCCKNYLMHGLLIYSRRNDLVQFINSSLHWTKPINALMLFSPSYCTICIRTKELLYWPIHVYHNIFVYNHMSYMEYIVEALWWGQMLRYCFWHLIQIIFCPCRWEYVIDLQLDR